MSSVMKPILISEEEYLKQELHSNIKHEYIDGHVYAMTGASDNHNKISGNVFSELKVQLKQKNSACVVYMSDMKLKVNSKYFYPDVMVVCNKQDTKDKYYKTQPVIIIEVLSYSTRKTDLHAKKLIYQSIPSLKEYIIIEQDKMEIQVCRKKDHWQSNYYYSGNKIKLESIDVSLMVDDIYYQVTNLEIIPQEELEP